MARRNYDDEFKKQAVQLVNDGRRIRDVERSLGITIGVLKHWVNEEKIAALNETQVVKGKKKSDELRIKTLEKEVETLRRERDILKKAVAIFSKEQNPSSSS